MAQIRVYEEIVNGFLELTGNTLLMGGTAVNSIGGLTQAVPAPPGGTTIPLSNWPNCSSSAFLTGLTGSTVKAAFLAWMFTPFPSINNSYPSRDNPINFTTPLGTQSVSPNPDWSQDLDFGSPVSQVFSIRVADVTNLVSNADTGLYTVEGVPVVNNYGGWTLCVVWENQTRPPRYISIDTLDELHSNQDIDITVSGFSTPSTGTVTGRSSIVVGSVEPNIATGDVFFGPDTSSLAVLTGPNNLIGRFTASQINNANPESPNVGLLDTTGTYGNLNSPIGGYTPNARWHWDQTNVSIDGGLTNNQTQGVFRFGPSNNAELVHIIALQIDAAAPTFDVVKNVDRNFAVVGDTLVYTINIENVGNLTANNVLFTDMIPDDTEFVTGSVELNGTSLPLANPEDGILIGDVPVNTPQTITFNVVVTFIPSPNIIENVGSITYDYTPGAGGTLSGSDTSNIVSTQIENLSILMAKSSNTQSASIGDILTYTTLITNNGTVTINNVLFTDPPPVGTEFITGSVEIDGANDPNADPSIGINLGTIAPGNSVEVSFMVQLIDITSSSVTHISNISFEYQIPSEPIERGTAQSNSVTVLVNRLEVTVCSKQHYYNCYIKKQL